MKKRKKAPEPRAIRRKRPDQPASIPTVAPAQSLHLNRDQFKLQMKRFDAEDASAGKGPRLEKRLKSLVEKFAARDRLRSVKSTEKGKGKGRRDA